jgi:LacI family transcriptional regulator
MIGIVAANEGRLLDLGTRLRERFPHLGGGQGGEGVAFGEQRGGDGAEEFSALRGRGFPPLAGRGVRSVECALDRGMRVRRVARKAATGGGIDGDETHVGTVARVARETNRKHDARRNSDAVFGRDHLRRAGGSCVMPDMARGEKRPVTVHMIAEHVGVSPSAVSTVLSNRHEERRLAPSTVEKIRQAVRDLGYVPNVAARRLRAHDPEVSHLDLGILTSFEAPLFLVSRVLRQVQRAADARTGPGRRYSVSIDMFHAGRLREMPGLLNASRFNGVIITNTLPEDDAFLATTTLPYAVVVLGRRLANYCCVLDTPGESGRRAAEILLGRGGKRLVVLTPALLTQSTADRADAFCATVREQSGSEPARVSASGFAPASGAEALRSHLSSGRGCDGLYAVTDGLALGAYQAIKDAGRRIPRDIAVVGVGDHEHADFFDPPLTCVGPSSDTIVEQVVSQLFQMMNRRRVNPVEIFVPPSVAMRVSA